jgi:hypothetical protein
MGLAETTYSPPAAPTNFAFSLEDHDKWPKFSS